MDYLHAIVLAILQGITEFLPISSSAHLILLPQFLSWEDQGLLFDVAVHLGTLFAVLYFLRTEIMRIIPAWFLGFTTRQWDAQGKMGWWIIVATIPVGIVGLLGNNWIELNLRSMSVIAFTSAFFGGLLWLSDKSAKGNQKKLASLSLIAAIAVGLAQALALIPGTSRSGVTMTALLAMGFTRIAAAKFSFLMAIPTIMLSGVLKAGELIQQQQATQWGPLSVAIIVSAITALLSLKGFIALIDKIGMLPFFVYRVLLALLILSFL